MSTPSTAGTGKPVTLPWDEGKDETQDWIVKLEKEKTDTE